jgi:hypothetical protein
MLYPITSGSNIGCIKSNFVAFFDGVETLTSDSMLSNNRIFHNVKSLFFSDRVTVNGQISLIDYLFYTFPRGIWHHYLSISLIYIDFIYMMNTSLSNKTRKTWRYPNLKVTTTKTTATLLRSSALFCRSHLGVFTALWQLHSFCELLLFPHLLERSVSYGYLTQYPSQPDG